MARVRAVIRLAAAAALGIRPGPVCKGIAAIPAISSHILWLKYHGVGRITSSPAPAKVAMTAQNA